MNTAFSTSVEYEDYIEIEPEAQSTQSVYLNSAELIEKEKQQTNEQPLEVVSTNTVESDTKKASIIEQKLNAARSGDRMLVIKCDGEQKTIKLKNNEYIILENEVNKCVTKREQIRYLDYFYNKHETTGLAVNYRCNMYYSRQCKSRI